MSRTPISSALAAMLDADPKLRAAWKGFTAQLARDAAMIAQRAQPTGQAIAAAAGLVHKLQARTQQDDDA